MTKEESAAYLGISVRSLQRLTAEGLFHPVTTGPKGVAVYDREELDSWKGLTDEEQRQARASAKATGLVMTRNSVTTTRPEIAPQSLLPPAPLADYLSRIASALEGQSVPELLTTAQVCERLKIGETTLRRLVGEGKLKPVHIGRLVRFRPDDLRAFIQSL